MLLKRLKNFGQSLHRNESGNALLLMALGMPVLIGSSGMAVDVAQWYIWKRELQYAVDQAALAGAWASAEPTQPVTIHVRSSTGMRPAKALPPMPLTIMPISTPPCCMPASEVDSPGVMLKISPANGSRIRSCIE